MINKLVTSKSGRKFSVSFYKNEEGITFKIHDIKSERSRIVKISSVALTNMVFGDDYVLILKHEVEKFEYCLDNPETVKFSDPSIVKLEEWDGNC